MRRFFGTLRNDKIIIENEELVHLKSVLRMKENEEVIVYLNDEYEYLCNLKKIEKNYAECEVKDKWVCPALPNKNIVLFQALAKREKFEFILQKAVELGITKVVPFMSEFCVVKSNENKRQRLETIILNACKQCERSKQMELEDVQSFDKFLSELSEFDVVLFANEREEKRFDFSKLNGKNIAIIVGAEGGFSEKEKQDIISKNAISLSLGKRILRCETASVAMMSMISILSEN